MNSMCIVLLDEHPVFRHTAALVLRSFYQDALTIVEIPLDHADVIAEVRRYCPRIVLLGVGLYSLSGFRLMPTLRRTIPDGKIVVLGPLDMEAFRQSALAAGADAFIPKTTLMHSLLPLIEQFTVIDATYTPADVKEEAALAVGALFGNEAPFCHEVPAKSLSQPYVMQGSSLNH